MARLTDRQRDLILADFHTNKYSQRELSKKHNVSLGTISKITKEVEPQNEHLVNAQMVVLKADSELPSEQMNAIMNTAKDEARRQGLIYDNAELLAKQIPKMVESCTVIDRDEKTGEETERFIMQPKELKELSEANDKIAITLKVADRHSNQSINVHTQNNMQQNQIGSIEDFYDS